jgi:hypothetical protein
MKIKKIENYFISYPDSNYIDVYKIYGTIGITRIINNEYYDIHLWKL